MTLAPKAGLAMSLAIHELATNAAKYGALSSATGHVEVSWQIGPDDALALQWRESGGPLVGKPKRRGFGLTLIQRALAMETGGRSTLTIEPSDRIRLPVTFGTMKTIENSSRVTADGVLKYVDHARATLDLNITISARELAAELLAQLLGEDLSDADRFLVQELINGIAIEVDEYNLRVPDEAIALHRVLDWVEQGAIMKGGRRA
jgi:hypothetical protein